MLVSPKAGFSGSFIIHRYCGCYLKNNNICGAQQYEAHRVDDSSIYNIYLPGKSESSGQMEIIWTDYTDYSLVSTPKRDRLWIYQKSPNGTDSLARKQIPPLGMDKRNFDSLYTLIEQHGFDPDRVILDGSTVYSLAQSNDHLYTATFVPPPCTTKQRDQFGFEFCPKSD